jgi:hypothetical protein
MQIRVFKDADSLIEHIPAWENLAEAALEPNPCYEHWMLLPALRHLGKGKDLRVLLVFAESGGSRPPLLCGIFPLERFRHYMSLPVPAWSFWRHNHCGLTTPLVRKEFARETIGAVFDWIQAESPACHLLEVKYIAGEGPVHQLLVDQFHAMGKLPFVLEWYTRAVFKPMDSAESYLSAVLSGKHRKAFRRRAQLLSELGPLQYTVAGPDAKIQDWIETFLRIEASGWKGKEGSAMACREADRNFLVETVTAAFQSNHLLMAALTVSGKTIAQNCYFLAGRGSFHFKPAFDEEYARFSPGFHMECELIRYLHSRPEIEWMDSCTNADNELFNRLFRERRTIQTLLVPLRGGVSGVLASAIPLLRSLHKTARSVFASGAPGRSAVNGQTPPSAAAEPDAARVGEP